MAREVLFKYVNLKTNQLLKSDRSFKSIFHVIHDQGKRIFAEHIEQYDLKTVSYTKIKELCYKTAYFLKTKITLPKKSFVGIYMDNCLEWVTSFWALLMIGYKPLLLNTKLPYDINEKVLSTLKSNLVIVNNKTPMKLKCNFIRLPNKQTINDSLLLSKEDWADEIAMCTTASSLNYKICVYSGQNMCNQMLNAKDIIKKCPRIKKHYKQRLKLLAFLPFYHIFGFVATYLWFSLFGRTIVFLRDYSSSTILYTIRRCNVTHIFSVPLFWNSISKEIIRNVKRQPANKQKAFFKMQKIMIGLQNVFPRFGQWLARKVFNRIIINSLGNSIKFVVSGGSYISNSTLYLLNSIGYPLANGYGTSEIGIISVNLAKTPKQRIKGSVGKAFKSVNVEIRNKHLFVKGTSTCSRFYFKDGTEVKLDNEWFDTLDVGCIDRHKNITIKGRADDVFVSLNGEKINPDVIEQQLDFNYVNSFVICNIHDKLSLIIYIPKDANFFQISKIKDEVKHNLEMLEQKNQHLDAIYYTHDRLSPVNAIKVSRKILYKLIAQKKIALKNFSLLKDPEENNNEFANNVNIAIKKIFADALNKDQKHIKNNLHFFLDLGGTSLEYCTCITKIENAFNIELNMDDKKCFTVSDFSNYIVNKQKGSKNE